MEWLNRRSRFCELTPGQQYPTFRGVQMKTALALVTLVVISVVSPAQDIRVREQAIQLLEKAKAATTPVSLPNLERTDTFRVFGSDATVREGMFTRVVIQGTGRRDETTFGDYHLVQVLSDHGRAAAQTQSMAPPEFVTLTHLTPIYHVSFDNTDVIHNIVSREVNGRQARCIEFDTVTGQKTSANEICIDSNDLTIVLQKLGDEHIENSGFFSFGGALLPGRIEYSFAGVPKMEITQTMVPLTEVTPNVLEAPPDAHVSFTCKTFRRAFGRSMPQPKPGNGGGDLEVVVRGMIGIDGRVHDPVVQSSERPELNPEALEVIRQWVFTPALCDGQLSYTEASFTLQFQGR
jgi:Gram-negative bacterial TonB protein C-terminal